VEAALDVQVFYAFNRLGITMKRLTAITVIIMVPNFVASIYWWSPA
jgi:Mg2+ and Co2+ transporter CorA